MAQFLFWTAFHSLFPSLSSSIPPFSVPFIPLQKAACILTAVSALCAPTMQVGMILFFCLVVKQLRVRSRRCFIPGLATAREPKGWGVLNDVVSLNNSTIVTRYKTL